MEHASNETELSHVDHSWHSGKNGTGRCWGGGSKLDAKPYENWLSSVCKSTINVYKPLFCAFDALWHHVELPPVKGVTIAVVHAVDPLQSALFERLAECEGIFQFGKRLIV
jgi:hypothetical protein